MDSPRITVLGIGNPLVEDEGVGVRVAEELLRLFDFPPEVTVMDAGTLGMSMLGVIRGSDYVLVVDAVDGTGHPPGTVVLMSAEDLADNQVLHSLHDLRFVDVLQAAALTGCEPESDFVGVQVEKMTVAQVGLTPPVEAAVPDAVAAVLGLLGGRGVVPSLREGEPVDARVLAALAPADRDRG